MPAKPRLFLAHELRESAWVIVLPVETHYCLIDRTMECPALDPLSPSREKSRPHFRDILIFSSESPCCVPRHDRNGKWVRSAGCEELHQVELKLPLAGCLSRGLREIGVKAVLVNRVDSNRPLR